MAVLTQKQIAERKAAAIQKGTPLKPAAASVLQNKNLENEKPREVKKLRWHLLHPERDSEGPVNFEDVIKINGTEYERIVVGSRLVTEELELFDFLIEKGWIFIKEEEIINGETKSVRY